MRHTLTAIRHLESATSESGLEGIILRYGSLYGPGTTSDGMLDQIRKRRMPVVGDGGAIWSFLHIDDAAHATVAAAEGGAPGVYNVVDDETRHRRKLASGAGEAHRLTTAAPCPPVVGAISHWRSRRHHDDHHSRSLQSKSENGVELDAVLEILARRLSQ